MKPDRICSQWAIEGPWSNEGDSETWIDAHTGLLCAIRRNVRDGALYREVKVPAGLLTERQTSTIPGINPAPGGVLKSCCGAFMYEEATNPGDAVFFFIRNHSGDLTPKLAYDIKRGEQYSQSEGYKAYEYRNWGYVKKEVQLLAQTIATEIGRAFIATFNTAA